MASFDTKSRTAMSTELRKLLPDTTLIYLDDKFEHPERYNVFIELEDGRLKSQEAIPAKGDKNIANVDLSKKLVALEKTDLFAGLSREQLRILAFSARSFTAPAGELIFSKGDDPADGAYLILEGEAGFYLPGKGKKGTLIRAVGPGNLVGEISLIRKEPRTLSMRAETDLKALRIGKAEFMAVVENDAATAFKLLQVISGYLIDRSSKDD